MVMGLDLSPAAPGVAYNDTPRTMAGTKLKEAARLRYWAREFAYLIDDVKPDVAVVEGYALGTNTPGHHSVVEMGGVIRLVLDTKGVPFAIVTATALKKYATGKGAHKGETPYERKFPVIQAALAHGATFHSRIKRTGERVYDDNAADAWWLYQMGLAHYAPNDQRVREVPVFNRQSLNSVKWPKLPRKVFA